MWYHLYAESKNYKLVHATEKKQTARYREQTWGHQCGERLRRGGGRRYTLLGERGAQGYAVQRGEYIQWLATTKNEK